MTSASMPVSLEPVSGVRTVDVSMVTTISITTVYTESSAEPSQIFTAMESTSTKQITVRPSPTFPLSVPVNDSHWVWILTTKEMWMIGAAILGLILLVSVVTTYFRVYYETELIWGYRLPYIPEEFRG
jgi:hypothetical protein